MKNNESLCYQMLFHIMMSYLTMSDGLLEWIQKPNINTELIRGRNASLQWKYNIPNGEVFKFLLITRYKDAKHSYARQTMAIKMADGRVEIYASFRNIINVTGAVTLNINKVEMSDETIYCCEVHYSAKSDINCVQAFVLDQPKITHYPRNRTVLEDTVVSLYCNATGIPVPSIEWYRIDSSYQRIHSGKTLNILMTRNNSGVFVCKAWNRIGAANGSAYIDVKYSPKAIVSLKSTVANQSDLVKVRCHVTGNPKPSIRWYKIEKRSRVLSLESTLDLKIRSKSDEGRYQCQANNGIGNSSDDIITVFVQNYSPINASIETCPLNEQVAENQTFVMQCSSIANPSPTYRIYHNQKLIKENRSGYHKICRVKEVTLENTHASPRIAMALEKVYPPTVTVHPRTIKLKEGAVATLKCDATGNPYPNIIWQKEGVSGILSTSNVLVINGTRRSDTGNYICRAYNGIGTSVLSSSHLEIYYTPEIIIPPINVTILETLNTSFYCEAVGNPEPIITWMKLENGIFRALNSSEERLKLIHTSRADAGVYVCIASNIIGNVSVSTKLDVQYKPSNTRLFSSPAQNTVQIKDSVTMYCQTEASPSADLYQFFYGDNLIAITNNGAHHLITVEKEHEGVYRCKALNTLGLGDTANMFLRVKVPASIVLYPKNQTLNEGDTLILTCVANGDPFPNITWTMRNSSIVISNEQVLELKNTTRINGGVYECSAGNGVGENVMAVARVMVKYKPNVAVARTSLHRKDSRNEIQLSCTATGYPLPVIVWSPRSRNSTVLCRAISMTKRVSTVVFKIAKTLDGVDVIRCYAWNTMGNAFGNVTLRRVEKYESQHHSANTWFGLSLFNVLGIMIGFMAVFIAAVVMATVYKQRRSGKVVLSK
ncbi:hemicentin-2-like [Actinia tenebrosa]|uniref:Hemicentin-2-like n=1 Tax=Actinia tenebrosa TaxID=6105 RepID=A0A6P8IML7_ACTTE|nr:hemicentin-2-like [Actinia tenebrosa]